MADAYTPPAASSQYPTQRTGLEAVAAEIRGVKRRQDESERSRTLQSAAISSGGLVVKDGGSVTVQGGGGVRVEDGGDVVVSGGDVEVQDGGSLNVRQGGRVSGHHPDGSEGALFGPLYDAETGDPSGVGLLVQAPASAGGGDIFKAKYDVPGGLGRHVQFGETEYPVDAFWVRSGDIWLRSEGSTGTGGAAPLVLSCAGDVSIYSETGRLRVPWTNASAAANVALDADGIIQRVSSARKYKQDVRDYDADPDAVLALQPRSWRDRGEVERDPDTTNRYVGFIAEEVHDAGLTDLVVYDADGNPDALSYDRFPAALLALLRRQQDQIDTLTRELGELRTRLPEEAP
ncbi:tail fiber domain-containing protein [Cellulosimicrobium sp. 22601]|uniref:tail fiber domain-containing protein n=1 Tax=unclassified Cellulosimicrobium TaxID=2624466 RepID=UPI003F8703F4